ncbi:hypothetical protein BD289DRAFT_489168 [Coniella lustricola]|uniref:Actin cytoskeleton-regulatory complex protein SLA1 n=1 Tax=Coniella lustricola TaxID=2025994 RepID=A0A2T3A2D6_9PEZI|nr:hypothetical protein BD289DRAFT_489168 [Coniella lustricola]
MAFLGVYKALYDYAPQSEGELEISEGDLLYVLEKSEDDDWWKAKKKARGEDEDEPVGLIPNNYIEEAHPTEKARALYEYTRQTDEELSFPEDVELDVYDTSDPDWILVGLNGDYGFVPANYIAVGDTGDHEHAAPEPEDEHEPAPPSLPTRPPAAPVGAYDEEDEEEASPPLPARSIPPPPEPSSPEAPNPAAALAAAIGGGGRVPPPSVARDTPPPPAINIPPPPRQAPPPSEDEVSPPLPARTRSIASTVDHGRRESLSPNPSSSTYRDPFPQYDRRQPAGRDYEPRSQDLSPGGFHLYNINEMISIMGKKKKMPTTLGINLKTGKILIAPEHAQDGPSQEWPADRMTHYSREGKHVFLEFVRPSKSVDFHAGAKDTAEEIVAALGELAGAVRAEGLREVIMAGTSRDLKKGKMLYDFMAQGEDEVTVADGDEVIILDDMKSDEWWQVRRVKNGQEGVVPSSYVDIIGFAPPAPPSMSGINAGLSSVAQNRLEEERLTKQAVKVARTDDEKRGSEVGPGLRLPERSSSLSSKERNGNFLSQRKRENGHGSSNSRSIKSKPDPSKVRTWSDRSKSFSVDAQFLGLKDGKINLHKVNGVKIAVPIAKMSVEDLEYVERATGISLDEDKPLSDIKRSKSRASAPVGASIEQPKRPEYDWFQFFLSCDIQVGLCERYAQAFSRDNMDETVLPDVDASVLRTLGLREGDIIKVMRFIDSKYGRKKKGDEVQGEGGLFSGPGGALKNNTGRPRPEANRSASDLVDPKALSAGNKDSEASSPATLTPATTTSAVSTGKPSGFDDDAWDVKPAKSQPTPEPPAPAVAPAPVAAEPPKPATTLLTPGMQELSLLTEPLQPTHTAAPVQPPPVITQPPAPVQAPQATGASPGFFAGLSPAQTGLPNGQSPTTPLSHQLSLARQRPAPPSAVQGQPGMIPPPPTRPLSAPQTAQPSAFGPPPLAPHITGQVAPPGQSLNDLNQQRLQQQYTMQMQSQMTGYPQQSPGFPQQSPGFPQQSPAAMYPMQTGMQPQATGFGQGQFMQPMMTGVSQQSPFADPRASQQFAPMQMQPTGFNPAYGGNPPGGVNSYLPPALEPQRTGMSAQMQPMQPQPTGMSFTQGFGNHGMSPSQPQPPAPLVPQQTGPPPPVRFGVQADAKKLAPQATGRRANLSAATPDNPFGF